MPAVRVLLGLALLVGAFGVATGAFVQLRRGVELRPREPGVVRDVRDVRRRAAAALTEAVGVGVLALGLLVHVRPLVWLGAVTTVAGALAMSVARRGLARRPGR